MLYISFVHFILACVYYSYLQKKKVVESCLSKWSYTYNILISFCILFPCNFFLLLLFATGIFMPLISKLYLNMANWYSFDAKGVLDPSENVVASYLHSFKSLIVWRTICNDIYQILVCLRVWGDYAIIISLYSRSMNHYRMLE